MSNLKRISEFHVTEETCLYTLVSRSSNKDFNVSAASAHWALRASAFLERASRSLVATSMEACFSLIWAVQG